MSKRDSLGKFGSLGFPADLLKRFPPELLAGFPAGSAGAASRRESTLLAPEGSTEYLGPLVLEQRKSSTFAGVPLGPRGEAGEPAMKRSKSEEKNPVGSAGAGEGPALPPALGPFLGPFGSAAPSLRRTLIPSAMLERLCQRTPLCELSSGAVESILGYLGMGYSPSYPMSPALIQQWIREPGTIPADMMNLIPGWRRMPDWKIVKTFTSSCGDVRGYCATLPSGERKFIKQVRVRERRHYAENIAMVLIQNYLSFRTDCDVPMIQAVYRQCEKRIQREEQEDGSIVEREVIDHYFATVSEYVSFGSLSNCLYNGIHDDTIRAYRPLTSEELTDILDQACEITRRAWTNSGFVHGDYHLGNFGLYRRKNGALKVVMYDFDFATLTGPDGSVFGTGASVGIDIPEWAHGGDESPAPPSGLDEDAYCRAIELVRYLYDNEDRNLREEPEEDEEGNTVKLGVRYSLKLEELVRAEGGRHAGYGDSIYAKYNLFVELMNIRNKYKEDEAALKSKHPNVISRETATGLVNKILDKYYEDGFNVFWRIYEMEKIGGFKFVAFILSKSPGAMRAVFPEVDLGIFYSDSPRHRLDLDGEGTGEAAEVEAGVAAAGVAAAGAAAAGAEEGASQ